MSELKRLRVFARVAHLRSFSLAAEELGISQSMVSRMVAALEREMGVVLLARTTRDIVLTDAGQNCLLLVEPILAQLDEVRLAIRGDGQFRGSLRIGIPTGFALEIVPRMDAFVREHPTLRIDFMVDDRKLNLMRDNIDIAIRSGELDQSSGMARLIGMNQRMLVAAPAYCERAGIPKTPPDLSRHRLISGPAGSSAGAWTFCRAGQTVSVDVQPAYTTNVSELSIAAAVAGLGIVSTGFLACRHELDNGQLVEILPDWSMSKLPIHVIIPSGRSAKGSARALADYLETELRIVAEGGDSRTGSRGSEQEMVPIAGAKRPSSQGGSHHEH